MLNGITIEWHGIHTVISGGQTGADQAGLVAARDAGIKTGGTAPLNWQTSIGPNVLLKSFNLVEGAAGYRSRTKKNVVDSDATLILVWDPTSPGSRQTRRFCVELNKPVLVITFDNVVEELKAAEKFIVENSVSILNVAGNRDSNELQPFFHECKKFLSSLFATLEKRNFVIHAV